ncbi:MAG: crossover junction endodeoxyribonuclease RuvC [Kiritimatiellaeota bacterium]|nr:crossover junction endodeoxyribonuclease RuvC [Kiritimatiellota bacterium]
MSSPLRILGVDASLRSTGVGVVEEVGSRMIAVWHGVIKNPSARPLSACLVHLQDEIARHIEEHRPHAIAIEGVFYAKNVKTMMILSHARGVMIAQCARVALPVYEYEPRRVKMAVVGYGAAQKEQVQKMVKTLLNLPEEPPSDAADALALAITHLHNRARITAQTLEPI